MSHGLVALGSAAVLTVYTAGYARTRDAADRLDAAQRQRPVVPAPSPVVAATSAPAPALDAPIAAPPTPAPVPAPATTRARDLAPRAPAPTPADSTKPDSTKTKTKDRTPAPVATPAPVEATPTPTPAPAAPPAPKWFDGSYSGWGRSRHGDIQATVAIENGKITYVAISICDTRYPCDVIAKLPAQVLERQSPEVDFVAGATESTNAFYYAVVEALKKAK